MNSDARLRLVDAEFEDIGDQRRSDRRSADRRAPRMRLMQLSAAAATMLVVGIAPLPSGMTVSDLAGQATEHARLWAASEGLYPSSWPTLAATEGTPIDHPADVTFMPPPSRSALAEREIAMALPGAARAPSRSVNYGLEFTPASATRTLSIAAEATVSNPSDLAPLPAPASAQPASTADSPTVQFGL